jgi:periplasmic divalent cation tolerance protein
MGKYVQVVTTVGTREDADRIARAVVEQRLAACAQVTGPITSTYWWEGAIETGEEWLCVIKSTEAAYPALEEAIRAIHPYEVPEIMAVPVVAGSAAYLAWLEGEIGGTA